VVYAIVMRTIKSTINSLMDKFKQALLNKRMLTWWKPNGA